MISEQWYPKNMGQSPSRPMGSKNGRRRSMRSPLPRKSKTNLSHTFSVSIQENVDLVNINSASEEQLMTLPGITRQIAQAIVDHRQAIGRFKRVDDLALVSGMGAEKLSHIRGEICVNRKLQSDSSSRTQSLDSVRSSDSSRPQLDINSINVFQLQCVPGLNQELAANIIDYRKKKGPFKVLDDVIKVKGIDPFRLGAIKSHLTLIPVDSIPATKLTRIDHLNNGTNGDIRTHIASINLNGSAGLPRTPGHRKTLSMPIKYTPSLTNGFSLAPVNDIFDLLSAYSHRPIIEEEFNYRRNSKSAVRVASWNLHKLNIEKANNPGIREVVCRTVLENRISILSIQEVLEEEALKLICDELNTPNLRRVNEWKDNSRLWHWCMSLGKIGNGQHFGFIYDGGNVHIPINIAQCAQSEESLKTISLSRSISECPNFNYAIMKFQAGRSSILLLNIHLMESNSDYSNTLICEMTDKLLGVNSNVVILGDFNSLKNVEDLASCYKSVIEPECSTLVDGSGAQGRGGMLVAGCERSCYAGTAGVVRSGLSHLAIPRGWSWGGPASPYCPIWAEFYTC